MIETICSLTEVDQQENRKRFDDSYVTKEKQQFSSDKPADFRDLFEGNADDMFRLGVKFTRKTIKFFSQENGRVFIHPSSTLFGSQSFSGSAAYMSYFSIISTSKIFIRDLTRKFF